VCQDLQQSTASTFPPVARHELVEDPAGWISINEKTGTIKTIKKMDRESSFVDEKSVYKIIIRATDNGTQEQSCSFSSHTSWTT